MGRGKQGFVFEPYAVAADDPLREAHSLVSQWIEAAVKAAGEHRYYQQVPLKSLPVGQAILEAKPAEAVRFVVAAVLQLDHLDKLAARLRDQAESEMQRINAHILPGWGDVWGRRRQGLTIVEALMMRSLPFEKNDLLVILRWCAGADDLNGWFAPIGAIVRAVQRFADSGEPDADLIETLGAVSAKLRASHVKELRRYSMSIDELGERQESSASPSVHRRDTPVAAPAGHPRVLEQLKRHLGTAAGLGGTQIIEVGPDRFRMSADSPLRDEHVLLGQLFDEVIGRAGYNEPDLEKLQAGRVILAMSPPVRGRLLLAAVERAVAGLLVSLDLGEHAQWQARYAASSVVAQLLLMPFMLTREGVFDLLLYLGAQPRLLHQESLLELRESLLNLAAAEASASALTEGERYVLHLLRNTLVATSPLGRAPPQVKQLTDLIGDQAKFFLMPGEVWTDAVNADLGRVADNERDNWVALVKHMLTATSARPSAKWLTAAETAAKAIGKKRVLDRLLNWLARVPKGVSYSRLGAFQGDTRSAADVIDGESGDCLRGFLWLLPALDRGDDTVRSIAQVVVSAYKKVTGVGPRAVKVGNAGVYALAAAASPMALGQLSMLKVRVKFGTAQREIEKAFNSCAAALEIPREDIEEMGVPSYGLEKVGLRCEQFGEYTAELRVTGSDAKLHWSDAKGKALKSIPAKVKQDHKEDLKDLQQSLKDIQAMLPAQRDRIDSMFLIQRSWPINVWRERYLGHPLVGTIARRLIWCIDGTAAVFVDGQWVDLGGQPMKAAATAQVTLWHPIGRSIEEITGWRRVLEQRGIVQPFKQAHREVYLLTDAERNTSTYSNRFAAHVLRQHQFNALCAARGWKNKLRLMVDDTYPPASKDLPQWGLRVEYWIEGIGDNFGTDTNECGVYLRVATDQVRFYRTGTEQNTAHAGGGGYGGGAAEALPLDQIPPLVLSEVMRDVDLFVGVASVGNDPAWSDGGPGNRFRDYWQSFSFGDLSATAQTRRHVLEKLVPRLKIASQCSLTDRFLVVRGQKRTYKIHLGSGNILMEPNDQYLCIVPDARSRAEEPSIHLPFEGDGTLSIILSKAFLLAEDSRITDSTITRQIR